jgi:uncharacterized membrane protein YedE/YeeE
MSAFARIGGDLVQREAGRIAKAGALWLLGALIILTALGFLLAGIYLAIANALSPLPALFIMAGGLLVIAMIVFAIAARQGRRPRRSPPPAELSTELGLAPEGGRSNLAAVAAAFAFGFARGLSRRRRG